MIAASISQKGYAVNSIKSLSAYILRAGSSLPEDPRDWGLARDHVNEAVAWAKSVNCVGPHLGWSVAEADAVQRMNKRATTCKCYHYTISFPEGEQPSSEILENIEDVLSTAIGYREHQRIIAAHRDTPNFHLHVAINKVHPETFRCIGSKHDRFTLQRVAGELEQLHGLSQTNHTPFTRTRARPLYIPVKQTQTQERDPELYRQFKLARQQAYKAQQEALRALRAQHQAYFKKLVAWHRERRDNARAAHLNRGDRLSTFVYLRETAKQDYDEHKKNEQQDRERLKIQFPLLTDFEAFKRNALANAHANVRENAALHFSERSRGSGHYR